MGLVHLYAKRLLISLGMALLAAVMALALTATARAGNTCGAFRVLHDDRIGSAAFPAGLYAVESSEDLSCEAASRLFARFLEDWDGNLPRPWRVTSEGSGKANFTHGGLTGFMVSRMSGGGEGGGHSELGRLCGGTYTVNAGSQVGPLFFPKGQYLLYIPPNSAISCRRASVLFTRFLAAPGGTLPFPWRLKNQIATFYKSSHPLRSAFRIEPLHGA